MKKRNIIILACFVFFLCSAVGSIVSFTHKPDLYYPAVVPGNDEAYDIFEKEFNTKGAWLLYTDADCSAGNGDFIALQVFRSYESNYNTSYSEHIDDKEHLITLAEKMVGQGAKAVVYDVLPDIEYQYSGTLFVKNGDAIEQIRLLEKNAEQFSKRLSQYADRPLAVPLSICSVILLLTLIFLITGGFIRCAAVRPSSAFGIRKEGTVEAAIKLSKARYLISVVAAAFMLLGTLAWLIAPNIAMLSQHYFEKSVFTASLVSLPFLFCAAAALLNLMAFRKFRRWLNIVCLTVAGIALAILLFSVAMMLFT